MTFTSKTKPPKGRGHGAKEWIFQRISALGLIWLSLWFAKFCMVLAGDTQEEMVERFQSPYNATMWILFLSFGFYHGWIGVREIMEDYIHCEDLKGGLKIVTLFLVLFLYTIGILSILKLFLS